MITSQQPLASNELLEMTTQTASKMANAQKAILNGTNTHTSPSAKQDELADQAQGGSVSESGDVDSAEDSDEDPLGDLEELERREDIDSNWDKYVDVSDLMAAFDTEHSSAQSTLPEPDEAVVAQFIAKNVAKSSKAKRPGMWIAAEELGLWTMFWTTSGKVDDEARKGLTCPKRAKVFDVWCKINGLYGDRTWASMEQHMDKLLDNNKTYEALRAEVAKAYGDDIAAHVVGEALEVINGAKRSTKRSKRATKKTDTTGAATSGLATLTMEPSTEVVEEQVAEQQADEEAGSGEYEDADAEDAMVLD
ncbi:hypothetical protein LTR27_002223 [Elasticomyces elasticus]|nr:hypothetical protein LTR27_002223 [Elasticomyces elasticus]